MRRVLLVAAVVALALPAAAAGANGGDDIATAPELPTTVRQYSAKFGPDFWKVFLNVGDLMTIDYASTDGDKVSFCLLPPTVTGGATTTTATTTTTTEPSTTEPTLPATTTGETTTTTRTTMAGTTNTPTLTDEQCAGADTTFSANRLSLAVVNPPGYWTLVFADGLCAPHNYFTTCPTSDVAYAVTLTVHHFTQTIVSLPTTAPVGRQLTLAGRVIGTTGGFVQISTQRKGTWVVLGLSPIGINGRFARLVRLPRVLARRC